MKEHIIGMIWVLLIAVVAWITMAELTDYIARANIYGDNLQREKMNQCLEKLDQNYKSCYRAIYNNLSFKEQP